MKTTGLLKKKKVAVLELGFGSDLVRFCMQREAFAAGKDAGGNTSSRINTEYKAGLRASSRFKRAVWALLQSLSVQQGPCRGLTRQPG